MGRRHNTGMTMKKSQLEKMKGKKITGGGYGGATDRYGRGAAGQGKARDPKLSPVATGLLSKWLKTK
jgi:hypothetical protein